MSSIRLTYDGRCHRPGLLDFLSRLKHQYEMHVYTMGTRAYAFEVCKAIDPDQSVFNNRVLTRDESGSTFESSFYRRFRPSRPLFILGMTSKNLQRLFPSDQSMVAIIDDRSDIWADVPNLIKVNPCAFAIHSIHLPIT
jgi:RNA polymerase II subunit A-like phosphatase